MFAHIRLLLINLLAVVLAGGCVRNGVTSADSLPRQIQQSVDPNAIDLTQAAHAYADSVVSGMTLEQMVGQLVIPASYTSTDDATVSKLLSYVTESKVGGIAFHKGDVEAMRTLADLLNERSDIPLFLAIDAENGLGMRLEGAKVYPLNYQLTGASEQGMYDYGHDVGEECGELGINMIFGPVLDVVPGPGWYLYKRSLGSEPKKVAELGGAYARGLHDTGVIPVAKHFPGHGFTRTDPHVWLPVIDKTEEEFRAVDLFPFSKYVERGFPAIMAAHVAVPSLTGDSLPADFSEKILKDILRNEMKVDGLIISDAVNMGAVKVVEGAAAPPPVLALLAGVDMILAPEDTRVAITQIITAVRAGLLPVDILRARTHRVLFYKYLYLFPENGVGLTMTD